MNKGIVLTTGAAIVARSVVQDIDGDRNDDLVMAWERQSGNRNITTIVIYDVVTKAKLNSFKQRVRDD